ncbi:hypothetical protein [Enterococcus dispar]|uniref:hypothetical protein n=1 Tax=Enterococcus dispar TaxID=44009 RepID=UPI003CD0D742
MALSANIKDLTVVDSYDNDTHEMFADIGTGFVYFTTVDQHAIKQHDISMTFEEWELFKKIIDMGIAREKDKQK